MTTKSHKTNPADKVEQWPIENLVPYAKNSRTHSEEQVAQIAASIREWGFTTAVLVDESGSIIAGHGRVMAARKLGMASLPVMVATGWTDAQKRAYVIADNKLALNAGWDNELLALEFSELQGMDFDLDLTGFTADEIAALMPEEIEPGKTDEDAVPEVPVNPVTVLGDVWILGKHRLMCGDSTSIDAIDRLLADEQISAIVTDPPYGIGIDGQKESKNKNPKHNRKAHAFMGWDTERPDEGIFNYIVAANVPAVIWGGNYFADILPPTRGWLYWSKGQDGLTMSDGELAWTTETTPLRAITVNRSALKGSVHPTQKPLQIVEFSLDYIKAGPVVLDLFGGSGSTLIACEKTNRKARLMELAPQYCDVIVKRWQDFTGKIAVHAETGQPFAEVKDGSTKTHN
jgi:ParB-like chromosome segregation protein Spo0J